ncbi:cytochrome c subunit of aldehyde dehydrogenase [Neoasaia chiangmaiensis NBRC 101099]|uniref:Aldehyde dehydrogenase n=1 Tax=Neoasaia chiangmaiensis TaxID=320497 RepID=A0A1U9KS45_9PROT|nr:cytochrome c [Neoasaia chiangmaiensis]AQS88646.1 aldehyde dehydrogenase [Neoasaia chiangmaiensis]GBR41173.1 cytochrome c subunit of aldehyde dehydrogenase [Neoasaia chiangmaiensis NBRC 101099]GEN13582.1 cytochrome c [Neoasaia chiangmaiensis]
MTLIKRVVGAVVGLGVVGGVGFLAYAWYPSIAPVSPPAASSFSPEAIHRGQLVAAAGYCAECHTRTDNGGGPRMAGDYKMETPFGDIFSSNITPDPETGIGNWSEAAFKRAMNLGIARDGSQLYPAFPFDHFTKVSDQDVSDLYAYLMSQPAIHRAPRENTVPFPINIRLIGQGFWKLLFFSPGRYRNDPAHDAEWNRGAYLAEGDAHCGACHTPRNALGAEKKSALYDGNVIDGWIAPPLNEHNPTPVVWTEDELFKYLRHGVAPLHGSAAGPMNPIPHEFLSELPESDVRAIAHYYADVDHAAQREGQNQAAVATAMDRSKANLIGPQTDPDARLYQGACAACHYNAGPAPVPGRPELALNNALWLDEPNNLFMVMLHGIGAREGQDGIAMPSFYTGLSDHDMARIAAYLRRTRTNLPPWTDLEKKAAKMRATLKPPPINASH